MARYVEPLVGHLKAFLKHRKFKEGTKEVCTPPLTLTLG